jgi:Rieske Fe-S protein
MAKVQYPTNCTHFGSTPPAYDPKSLEIFVTPSKSFEVKPRNIFTDLVLKHVDSKEAYKWLSGPNMDYYPQQLAFALWCSTAGCGIGYDLLNKYKNPMIGSGSVEIPCSFYLSANTITNGSSFTKRHIFQ